jgi:hypothetical protein
VYRKGKEEKNHAIFQKIKQTRVKMEKKEEKSLRVLVECFWKNDNLDHAKE